MKITPQNAALISDWCKTSDATIEVPVVMLQQILRELLSAEIFFDKQSTYLNYYHHQDKETGSFMLESATSIKQQQQQQQEAKDLSSKLRDILIEEFVKSEQVT